MTTNYTSIQSNRSGQLVSLMAAPKFDISVETLQTPRPPGSAALPKSRGSRTLTSKRKFGSAHGDHVGLPTPLRPLATPLGGPSTSARQSSQNSTLVALVEGRGNARGSVGLATIDLRRPELILSQFSDSVTYVKTFTKLHIFSPVQVIMPNTAYETGTNMSKLISLITDQFPSTNIVTVKRKYFNAERGLETITRLCLSEYKIVEMEVIEKYYCLSAAAALIKYVEFIQNIVYSPRSLKIVFTGSEKSTMIDSATARNLELTHNIRNPNNTDDTLFGLINATKTGCGERLLRSEVLQPPFDVDTSNTRLDTVSELTQNEELFSRLEDILSRFLDLEHLIALCIQIPKSESVRLMEHKIIQVIYLKHTLELVQPLSEILDNATSPLLTTYRSCLDDPRLESMRRKIDDVVHPDSHFSRKTLDMRTQKCFAVKSGLNGMLDVARRTYTETVEDISEMIGQLADKYKLSLRTGFNVTRGFFVTLQLDKDSSALELPPVFEQVVRAKKNVTMTTADLRQMNDRINESLQDIYMLTGQVINGLLDVLREDIGCLYKLTEAIAMIDLLWSCAYFATVNPVTCVRPEFSDTTAIKQGVNPLVQALNAREHFVPNDVYLHEGCSFVVITGPNMSGKSVYLRQIALLQIMAQIGYFVPAQYACFRPADHLFSRIGSDDKIETNSSTFMLECQEMSFILQNVTSNSLVVIDELGRATSSEEGIGICYALCEKILMSGAFCIFATHFKELTALECYPNVENFHFEVQRVEQMGSTSHTKIVNTHSLVKGSTKEKHYGLDLAEASSLPPDIVDEARIVAGRLDTLWEEHESLRAHTLAERAVVKLATRLGQIARNTLLDEEALRAYLISIQRQQRSLQQS
eukprot:m.119619 g.119619  ORF g.119619 m.119619 type:complete len:869 (+) comp14532_c0_seq3:2474-5080(+)